MIGKAALPEALVTIPLCFFLVEKISTFWEWAELIHFPQKTLQVFYVFTIIQD